MFRFLMIGLLFAPWAHAMEVVDPNTEINPIYDLFVQAYQQLDAAPLSQRYGVKACMMGVSERDGFFEGPEQIRTAYQRWFDKIRAKEGSIDIRFRVVNRNVSDETVTDAGFYLIRYSPAESSQQAPSEFAGKFIMTFRQDDQGEWQIEVDSASRVKAELFHQATAKQGLYFAEPFEIMAAQDSHPEP